MVMPAAKRKGEKRKVPRDFNSSALEKTGHSTLRKASHTYSLGGRKKREEMW